MQTIFAGFCIRTSNVTVNIAKITTPRNKATLQCDVESVQRRPARFVLSNHRNMSRVSTMSQRLGWHSLETPDSPYMNTIPVVRGRVLGTRMTASSQPTSSHNMFCYAGLIPEMVVRPQNSPWLERPATRHRWPRHAYYLQGFGDGPVSIDPLSSCI